MIKYRDYLCPGGWRVPTKYDFYNLTMVLGKAGEVQRDTTISNKYLTIWGGVHGGDCTIRGELDYQGIYGVYWSQTQESEGTQNRLYFSIHGTVRDNFFSRSSGMPVRCVK